jgi:hypothetical protein
MNMRNAWRKVAGIAAGILGGMLCLPSIPARAGELASGFLNPPEETKPWCYWYWLNNNVTEEGITKDLENMAHVGIKLAMIGNIEGGGPVKMFSPEWYRLTRHALAEAHRVGVEIMMFNAPGWSQTGGPWIKPEQSMRRVIWNEVPASGGPFSGRVRNETQEIDLIAFGGSTGKIRHEPQDIAVLALPVKEAVSLAGESLPANSESGSLLAFRHDKPFTARALVVRGQLDSRLYAVKEGTRELVAEIRTGGRNPTTDFLPDGDETFSFMDTTAREFVLEPCGLEGSKVTLTSEPMVAQVVEKQLGRLHPDPSPAWESYLFPDTVEPGDPATVTRVDEIIDLTEKLGADGVLDCTLPPGRWTILYFGMVPTGKVNNPAPPEGTGLEVDKMSRSLVEHHFNSMFGGLLKQVTPEERSAWVGVTIDSYEKGAQNWTDGFDKEFRKRNGYDPVALLPVLTGRVIGSAKVSDLFLWDLRRTVADMIATEYVGGLREIVNRNGMRLWCENYGHWGFPGEFMIYGRHADEIGGEFWTNMQLGSIECRAASSAAHVYGRRRVYAEAFTSTLDLNHHPYTIKARGEEMFCEGPNHFVLHVYAHQPKDGVPGRNPWFGTAFHRNTPWFNQSRDWITYLQRMHFMLQQGEPVADVAVYIGDFAPQMIGPANPVPPGHDYDYVSSDALLDTLHVADGEWVVYDAREPERIAARWPLLAMPEAGHIRPHVAERIEALRKAGGRFVEGVPVSRETMERGKVAPIVSETSCPIRWKARRLDDGMVFFLSNFAKTGAFEATLRVKGRRPELYHPATGRITRIARYQEMEKGTRISIDVKDRADSFFVVFRDKPARPSVVKVEAGGADVPPADLELYYDAAGGLVAESAKKGAYTLTLSDATRKSVVIDQDQAALPVAGPWKGTDQDATGHTVLLESSFTAPAGFGKDRHLYLDLGQVSVMAKVRLNGKEYETLWMPPFVLDVTDAVKSGENKLQVLVTSTSNGKPKLGDSVSVKAVPVRLVE